jgi:phenylalanyl-tRNA synthetase alpha chain
MINEINKIKGEILNKLSQAADDNALRDLQIKYLGRKGELTAILRKIADLNEADKKTIGRLANETKAEIEKRFKGTKEAILDKGQASGFIDMTMPGEKIARGHLHPITIVQNELEDLFSSLGFLVLDGPELESDYYNFEALNIPRHHPARDTQDTFYLDHRGKNNEYDLVMRTHTSPNQIRAMEKYGAPLKCVVPGRVFRYEATDMKHDNTFYQIEGLLIDRHISVANLVAVLKEMLIGMFQRDITMRVRPGYFPFTEPSLEVDIKCTICGGAGCPSCKGSGWIEMLGSGMVHPKVIAAGGLDPEIWNGFAFGLGIDRLVMMKYGVNDIRLMHSGDMRFLEQF